MRITNVKLSAAEMALACDAEVLLTKNKVIEKVYELFGELACHYVEVIKKVDLPPEILNASPKISRGENYLGLPWVVLDYPRLFKGEDYFSIRTFFWWGHYFSSSILVKGKWLGLINVENIAAFSNEKKWRITTVDDPWQHHILPENTEQIDGLKASAIQGLIDKNSFLKLQIFIAIEEWDLVQNFLEESFKTFLGLLSGTKLL